MTIKPVPKRYRGTWFRSTLEADWAATFDMFGWDWQYEPEALELPDGTRYRPDFYLQTQRVYAEVKGPHNERIVKPIDLQAALGYDDGFEWGVDLVVILRAPGPGETAMWEGTSPGQNIVIIRCRECGHHGFMDHNGLWSCRRHLRISGEARPWIEPGELYWPGDIGFRRADSDDRNFGKGTPGGGDWVA